MAIEETETSEGNGQPNEGGVLYELAEFDFTELAKEVPLEHFHFSQRRSIFEIGGGKTVNSSNCESTFCRLKRVRILES